MQENSEKSAIPDWLFCFLPCSGGTFFLFFITLFLLFAPTFILGDGAVARHITTGVDIIQTGKIAYSNYVWAIDPKYPWLTHELFGDLAIGASYLAAKLNGVVLLGFLVVASALMFSYQIARKQGLGRYSGWLLFIPMMIAQSLHWLTRGHIFSYLFMLVLYYVNFACELSIKIRMILSVLLLVLWCNFHGSIFVGLFMLSLPPLSRFIRAAWQGKLQTEKKAILLESSIVLLAGLALALNIRGFGEYSYLVHYLGHPEIVGKGSEWRSLDFALGPGIWSFLALFFALLFLWRISPQKPDIKYWLLCTALFFGGIYVMRMIPYFALICLPCMGICSKQIREWLISMPDDASPAKKRLKQLALIDEPEPLNKKKELIKAGVRSVLILAVSLIFLFHPRYHVKEFAPEKLPVAATEYIDQHAIKGLGFALDNWGPYLYWKYHTPIFVDEKTDFYPIAFMKEYHSCYSGETPEILDKYKVDYVLIQPEAGLVKWLNNSDKWQKNYEDKIAILYSRRKELH